MWTLNFGRVDVEFGCVDVEFWLCGRWNLVVLMLEFGCVDVEFWLGGC